MATVAEMMQEFALLQAGPGGRIIQCESKTPLTWSLKQTTFSTSMESILGVYPLMSLVHTNNSSVPQTTTFIDKKVTTDEFQWSITESLDVGVEVTASAGVPSVSSIEAKATVNIGLAATETQTTTEEQTWEIDEVVVVPPRTTVSDKFMLVTEQYRVDFAQIFNLDQIWLVQTVSASGVPTSWPGGVTIGLGYIMLRNAGKNDFIKGYSVQGSSLRATGLRQFTGTVGISGYRETDEISLDSDADNAGSNRSKIEYYTADQIKSLIIKRSPAS